MSLFTLLSFSPCINPESDQSAVVMENRMAMIIRLHDFLYVTLYFTPPYFTLDLLLYGFLTLLFLSGQASYPALPTLAVTRKKSDLVELGRRIIILSTYKSQSTKSCGI